MNQRGFATLEVILMVMVIGILASIAVPRFTNITAAANTAKIQSDLATIDTAIAVYKMEKGTTPAITDLGNYFQGGTVPKPPTGKYFLEGTLSTAELTNSDNYGIGMDSTGDTRAVLNGSTSDKFYTHPKTGTGTTPASTT